jgi:drug/metabolite transporter (DMT)-like permease
MVQALFPSKAAVLGMIGELAALGAALCWTFSAVLYKKALAEDKAYFGKCCALRWNKPHTSFGFRPNGESLMFLQVCQPKWFC